MDPIYPRIFVEYNRSHITLVWIWIMLSVATYMISDLFVSSHQLRVSYPMRRAESAHSRPTYLITLHVEPPSGFLLVKLEHHKDELNYLWAQLMEQVSYTSLSTPFYKTSKLEVLIAFASSIGQQSQLHSIACFFLPQVFIFGYYS